MPAVPENWKNAADAIPIVEMTASEMIRGRESVSDENIEGILGILR